MKINKFLFSLVQISTNGLISFDVPLSEFDGVGLPIQHFKLILPFFIDIDTTINSGRVYYRQTTDPLLVCRVSAYVREKRLDADNFQASWVFIATWHNVSYFRGNTNTPVSLRCIDFFYIFWLRTVCKV